MNTDIDYNFTEDRPRRVRIIDLDILITLLGGVLLIGGLGICTFFVLFLVIGLKNGFVEMWIVSLIAEIVGVILIILGYKLL